MDNVHKDVDEQDIPEDSSCAVEREDNWNQLPGEDRDSKACDDMDCWGGQVEGGGEYWDGLVEFERIYCQFQFIE